MKLGIYYEGEYNANIDYVKQTLPMVFPNLECFMVSSLCLPPQALDTFKRQYDVHYLLNYLEISANTEFLLWIVSQDIGDYNHSFLFGAAGGQRAVVSTARLNEPADIAKEACHEVGHLLGLGHCSNDCCMKISWSSKSVTNKNFSLCSTCLSNLTN